MGQGRFYHKVTTYYCMSCQEKTVVPFYKKIKICTNCGGGNLHVAL